MTMVMSPAVGRARIRHPAAKLLQGRHVSQDPLRFLMHELREGLPFAVGHLVQHMLHDLTEHLAPVFVQQNKI